VIIRTTFFLAAALLGVRLIAAAVAPAAAAPVPATARPSAVIAVTGFDAFRLISERNIFDPNRVGQSTRTGEPPPPRADLISLVGTMHYEKGLFAFFDGSAPAFRKALSEGESVADYAVAHIAANSVELVRNGQRLTLTVGQQLRRPVGGDWTVVALDTAHSEAKAQPADVSTDNPSATPAIPPDASDVLRRLMEQRQKQLKP
jgi:hypothetical protein